MPVVMFGYGFPNGKVYIYKYIYTYICIYIFIHWLRPTPPPLTVTGLEISVVASGGMAWYGVI